MAKRTGLSGSNERVFGQEMHFIQASLQMSEGLSGEGLRKICGPQASGYCQPGGAARWEPKVGREERFLLLGALRARLLTRSRVFKRHIKSQARPLVCVYQSAEGKAKIRRFAAYHLAGRMMKSRRCEAKSGQQHGESR